MRPHFVSCIFAHYHPQNVIDQACLKNLKGLNEIADEIIFISTSKLPLRETDKLNPLCRTVECRENIGLDFGSYKQGLKSIDTTKTDYLILANDSVYGPIFPLKETFDKAIKSKADVFGITLSDEKEPHLQSYFMLFKHNVIASDLFKVFWQDFDQRKKKKEIILEYEIGLSQQLQQAGFELDALHKSNYSSYTKIAWFLTKTQYGCKLYRLRKLIYKMSMDKDLGFNPMHLMAYRLVKKYRIPYIKKELIEKNPYQIKLSKSLLKLTAPFKN